MKRFETEYLSWDSDFFGFPVVRINLESSANEIKVSEVRESLGEVRLCYLFSKERLNNDLNSFEDERVVFQTSVVGRSIESVFELTSANEADGPDLQHLAFEAGLYSRFKLDSDLPAGTYEKLYRLWLDRSLRHEIADEVYIARSQECASGFVTLKKIDDVTEIGLIAVGTSFRGKGVGTMLLRSGFYFAEAKGCKGLRVVTQRRNDVAVEFYRRCGFSEISSQFIYHVWNQSSVQ